MKKFVSNIIMFILLFAYFGVVMFVFYKTMNNTALFVGIPLAVIYAFVCFFVKRVRSSWTIWWGILSILTACWWIYLLTQ